MNLSKQFTKREKVLLAVFAVLCLVLVYIFVVHKPIKDNLAEIALAKENAAMELQLLEAKEKRLNEMQAEIDEVVKDGDAVSIPDSDNLQQLMAFLDGIMADTNNYDIDIEAVELDENGNVLRRVMTMNFESSSYENARKALESLHACPYRYIIDELSIIPNEESHEEIENAVITSGNVNVSLTITFFENQKN